MTIKTKKFVLGVKVKYNSKMIGTLGQKFSNMGQKLVLGVIIFVLWFKSWYYGPKVGTWDEKFSTMVLKFTFWVISREKILKRIEPYTYNGSFPISIQSASMED